MDLYFYKYQLTIIIFITFIQKIGNEFIKYILK